MKMKSSKKSNLKEIRTKMDKQFDEIEKKHRLQGTLSEEDLQAIKEKKRELEKISQKQLADLKHSLNAAMEPVVHFLQRSSKILYNADQQDMRDRIKDLEGLLEIQWNFLIEIMREVSEYTLAVAGDKPDDQLTLNFHKRVEAVIDRLSGEMEKHKVKLRLVP